MVALEVLEAAVSSETGCSSGAYPGPSELCESTVTSFVGVCGGRRGGRVDSVVDAETRSVPNAVHHGADGGPAAPPRRPQHHVVLSPRTVRKRRPDSRSTGPFHLEGLEGWSAVANQSRLGCLLPGLRHPRKHGPSDLSAGRSPARRATATAATREWTPSFEWRLCV